MDISPLYGFGPPLPNKQLLKRGGDSEQFVKCQAEGEDRSHGFCPKFFLNMMPLIAQSFALLDVLWSDLQVNHLEVMEHSIGSHFRNTAATGRHSVVHK